MARHWLCNQPDAEHREPVEYLGRMIDPETGCVAVEESDG